MKGEMEIDDCVGEEECGIVWGDMSPDGMLEIVFAPKGPLKRFPSAHYGRAEITDWSCNRGVLDDLDGACKRNQLSPPRQLVMSGRVKRSHMDDSGCRSISTNPRAE